MGRRTCSHIERAEAVAVKVDMKFIFTSSDDHTRLYPYSKRRARDSSVAAGWGSISRFLGCGGQGLSSWMCSPVYGWWKTVFLIVGNGCLWLRKMKVAAC